MEGGEGGGRERVRGIKKGDNGSEGEKSERRETCIG